jgi:septal ring-binding cell division protein DamX
MSNQQNPHDEFGGFGESDDQTFLHDKSKLSSQSESTSSPEKGESKESGSGFISYVQPDVPPEEEQSSVKKVALIAITTVSALAIIWMMIPSKDGNGNNPEQIASVDTVTVAELNEEEARKQAQATTIEQDSIARVQDYLARMQMSEGQNIGNNERGDEIINEESKVSEKKVVPPDPIPAKTFPEYREAEDVKQTESSIQKDEPVQPKTRVQKPVSEIKKKQAKAIAQKPVKKDPEKKKPESNVSKKQSQQDQVLSETFMDKEPVKKNQEAKKVVKNTSGEEYSVQVLSSISKQEADKALKNLQSKGISSASISKKSLNGKTWYRVRFGSFEDRKQAQGAAKKAGYSNSWVDRVK